MAVPSTILDLSTSAASNSPAGSETVGPNLDNYLRAIEAILRQESENKAWERWGQTPTYISATSFSVTGDQTAVYTALRRIKCTVSGSPLYGSVVSAVFGAVTTVTVKLDSGSLTAGLTEVALGLENNALRYLNMDSSFNEAKGADIASAATTNIGAATGNYVNVTGTTTITAFDTVQAGTRRMVRFSGALTLTHNATSLILPGGANIVTRADDVAVFVSEGAGNWRCVDYVRGDGITLKADSAVGVARNVKMSVTAASASATLTADEIIAETALGGSAYQLSSFSKTINLATTGAGGMDTGSAPNNGYVALYAIYNPSTLSAALLATNAATLQGNVYGGANMPAGYTASALISVWPTNGSGQFKTGQQRGRKIFQPNTQVLTNGPLAASPTAVSISSAVPVNAISTSGSMGMNNSSSSNMNYNVGGDSNMSGQKYMSGTAPLSTSVPFDDVPIGSQTIYYTASSTAGSAFFNIFIANYEF